MNEMKSNNPHTVHKQHTFLRELKLKDPGGSWRGSLTAPKIDNNNVLYEGLSARE